MRNATLMSAGLVLALCVGCTKSTDHLYGTGEEPDAAVTGSEGEAEVESESEAESEAEAESEGELDAEVLPALADAGPESDATTLEADATLLAPDAEEPAVDATSVEPDANPATPDAASPTPDAGADTNPLPDAGPNTMPDATPDISPDTSPPDEFPTCPDENLLTNSEFESVVDDEWELVGSGGTFTRDCAISQSGSCSARIEVDGTGGEVWLTQSLMIPAGFNELCLFARATSETEVSAEIVQGRPFRFRTITVNSDWTGDCTSISTGASSVEIRFVIPNDAVRTVWIDTTHFGPRTCP